MNKFQGTGGKPFEPTVLQQKLEKIVHNDIKTIIQKNSEYGESWKGMPYSAFENLRRKWDRIVNQVKKNNYDILECVKNDQRKEGILDDIRDLRAYLLLIESEFTLLEEKPVYRQHEDNTGQVNPFGYKNDLEG